MKILLLPLMLALTACGLQPSVQLNWQSDVLAHYRASTGAFPVDMKVDINKLLQDPELLDSQIQQLRSLPLEVGKLPIQVQITGKSKNDIEVNMTLASISYDTEPKDEVERLHREQLAKNVGSPQLYTRVNEKGQNRLFYLKPFQKNLVSLLFEFPDEDQQVGDSWTLPVTLTSLNTAFIADNTERINKIWLRSIKDVDGEGRVAEIVYLLSEKVKGEIRYKVDEKGVERFDVESTYFAVGDFLLDQHRWKRYTGRLFSDFGLYQSVSLIAMHPKEGTLK